MPSAYSIPKRYEEEIEGVVAAGYYSNKSEVVREALRYFFDTKKNLKLAAAIELYKEDKVTLSRAAELADLTSIEFKEILADKGIKIIIPGKDSGEMRSQMSLLKKTRSAQ
ncbi:UPF0175 family protein [Candidatus Woesearchaeota archaeon]|nr:UPF0175 family protein [Candidatus Woesearchaeota archaeon]